MSALRQRVMTALVLAPLAVAAIVLLPTGAIAVIAAAAFGMALWEWTRMIGMASQVTRGVALVAFAALLGLLWWQRDTAVGWGVVVAGAAWWLLALVWLRHFSFAASPTPENVAIKLAAGAVAIAPAWAALLHIHGGEPRGHLWTLFALLLVWAADTFAYFAGRQWGRAKLAPRISPGKTIAGAWGALGGTVLVAVVGGWLLGERGVALALLIVVALITTAFSIVGDLFESLIKRQGNTKDSGSLFPGHGGLFDRLDSVFAALPVFAVGKTALDLMTGP
jgi:phosphatidate cytidylyltransferase